MRGRTALSVLLPREHAVFELLQRQARTAARAGELLEAIVHHWPDRSDLAQELEAVRDDAEAAGEAVFAHVHATFVTVLDREDLLGLSDAMTGFVRHADRASGLLGAYRVSRSREPARRSTRAAAVGSRELAEAVGRLRVRRDQLASVADLRRLDDEADGLLRHAMSELISDQPSAAELLAWRDIYAELETVTAALASATRILRAVELKGC
jgi:uncharacterized protein